jgi:hypothetical protein
MEGPLARTPPAGTPTTSFPRQQSEIRGMAPSVNPPAPVKKPSGEVPVSSILTASPSAVASLHVSAPLANRSLNHGAQFRTTKPRRDRKGACVETSRLALIRARLFSLAEGI